MKDKKLLISLLILSSLAFGLSNKCIGDLSAPSPKLIAIDHNILIINSLTDPCKVALLEVIYSKGNITKTLVSVTPNVETLAHLEVKLPRPPYTLTIIYADQANNTGTLSWTVTAEPYTLHPLVTMVVQGQSAVVQILGPPHKPLLPQKYSDPQFQATILTVLTLIAFIYGLVRHVKS